MAYTPVQNTAMFELMPVPTELNNGGWLEKFEFSGVVEQSMLVSTEFVKPMISVAALSFEGVPLTQLQFDTHTQQLITSNTLEIDLDGKKIIYDMQSAFWPLTSLEQSINEHCRVVELTVDGQVTRRFYRNEILVREITYTGALTQLIEFEQKYRLKIERLEEY
ncbi:DUF3261 domain-containing protein [Pseudoalteromonas sp. NEC-BIFX-2020_015]|uniref:DUF3261 domain-containing protein n=1 Tax=Pseudoalteromonas sp. NEC-BIFX-2020_015 TaxID=2729544 RepID=UPI0014616C8F|nr:DUF3261 domain-containing protein [Pseudoalteromonas sp. NEC-BIFX-2020_015]NMR25649.1 DUF3261 domain-containing protein [Pseudoalteromonas sp. NEC-BIFX-2020_015]